MSLALMPNPVSSAESHCNEKWNNHPLMFTMTVLTCDIRCSWDHDNVTASQQIHRGDSGDYSDGQHMSAGNIVTCHIIRCQPPGVLVSTVSVQARDSAPATAWLPPPVARPLQSSEAAAGPSLHHTLDCDHQWSPQSPPGHQPHDVTLQQSCHQLFKPFE